MDKSKRLHKKTKLVQDDDSINNHSKALEEEWKVMKLDHFSKETPHDIRTALEEEHKAILAANDMLIEQRLLFEEENNDLRFSLEMMRISSCSTSAAQSWRQSDPSWGCTKIPSLQSSLMILSGCKKKYSISRRVELRGSCQVGGNYQGYAR